MMLRRGIYGVSRFFFERYAGVATAEAEQVEAAVVISHGTACSACGQVPILVLFQDS